MAKNDIKTQLHELITANFPAIQATAMQEYVEQAEKDKSKLTTLEASLNAVRAERDEQAAEIKRLELRVRDLVPYKTKSDEVDEKARDLRVEMAELKVAEAEKRVGEINGLVTTIFMNSNVRRSVSTIGTTPLVVPGHVDPNGYNNMAPYTISQPFDSTTTEDITEN